MGSKRELEGQSRPSPVPGLGCTENIKLLYLKPQYFGCWDQSEHWVQCESSKKFDVNFDVGTYDHEFEAMKKDEVFVDVIPVSD